MTYSTDSLERFVTAVRIDLKTWPKLLPFRQPMPAGRPSRDFVVAFFLSVVFHVVFLALLLWIVATDRIAVEPTAPSIGTPLIVSLYTLATTSHDGLDREAVSVVPHTGQPTQRSQSSPERSRSAERKSEAETVVTSIGQGVPDSEAPEGKSLATNATPSFDLEAVYRIAREGSWMSESEVRNQRFKWRIRYMKNYRASLPPDCRTAYAKMGLLAIPLLIRDTITDSGCKW
jgi:hypothetical protein